MSTPAWRVLVVAAFLPGLVACGSATAPAGRGQGPGATAAATPGPARVRASGTVAAGAEPGCLTLSSGGRVYLLRGVARTLRPGRQVQVEGVLQPGLRTTCLQGTPLRVEHLAAK